MPDEHGADFFISYTQADRSRPATAPSIPPSPPPSTTWPCSSRPPTGWPRPSRSAAAPWPSTRPAGGLSRAFQTDPRHPCQRGMGRRDGERVGVVVLPAARMIHAISTARPRASFQHAEFADECRMVEDVDPPLAEQRLDLPIVGRPIAVHVAVADLGVREGPAILRRGSSGEPWVLGWHHYGATRRAGTASTTDHGGGHGQSP